MASSNPLSRIQHIVVLMLENRSFDSMLGFLYADQGNKSPSGQPFEGLTGKEANLDSTGKSIPVFKIEPTNKNAYFMPGTILARATPPPTPNSLAVSMLRRRRSPPTRGSSRTLLHSGGRKRRQAGQSKSCRERSIRISWASSPLRCCPVLSALARGYAVCDHWYCSLPTETMPNRAFVCAATSQGHMDDKTKSFTVPSIFGLLGQSNVSWTIYGYDTDPLTRHTFPDTSNADDSHFGLFKDFQAAAAGGTLPAYTFLEPSWSPTGNSQHPNYDVALGEQLIHDVYYAVYNGKAWEQTLLIITYDEHGCYDHVAPPLGAVPPDNTPGEYGFDFKRFAVCVPTVIVSPLVAPGTIFRVPAGTTPLDHTSILKTVEKRWELHALTARDAAAPDVGDVLTLNTARTDDPLQGVKVPQASGKDPAKGQPFSPTASAC